MQVGAAADTAIDGPAPHEQVAALGGSAVGGTGREGGLVVVVSNLHDGPLDIAVCDDTEADGRSRAAVSRSRRRHEDTCGARLPAGRAVKSGGGSSEVGQTGGGGAATAAPTCCLGAEKCRWQNSIQVRAVSHGVCGRAVLRLNAAALVHALRARATLAT